MQKISCKYQLNGAKNANVHKMFGKNHPSLTLLVNPFIQNEKSKRRCLNNIGLRKELVFTFIVSIESTILQKTNIKSFTKFDEIAIERRRKSVS